MKITEDMRKFAAEQKISETDALNVGMKEKAKEKEPSAPPYFPYLSYLPTLTL